MNLFSQQHEQHIKNTYNSVHAMHRAYTVFVWRNFWKTKRYNLTGKRFRRAFWVEALYSKRSWWHWFLADQTNGRAFRAKLCPSVVPLSVCNACIVAKRYVLPKKLSEQVNTVARPPTTPSYSSKQTELIRHNARLDDRAWYVLYQRWL